MVKSPPPSELRHSWLGDEEHPACKKLGVGFAGGDDLTEALHVL